ncbi:MAG: phage tail protein [Mangrovicoccus sp.]
MTQFALPDILADDPNGLQLAEILNNFNAALLSAHSGPERPEYAVAGTLWYKVVDDTKTLHVFDGTTDVPIPLGQEFIDHIANTENPHSLTLSQLGMTGSVAFFAMPSAPSGWLKANGAELSRETYSDLFAAIGTSFGEGDGVATFNVPDLRGEFIRGLDDGRGVDTGRVLGTWQAEDWKSFWMKNTLSNVETGYSHGSVWMGKNVTPEDYVGNLFAGYWSKPSAAIGTRWNTEENRPRNIALLPCIKY